MISRFWSKGPEWLYNISSQYLPCTWKWTRNVSWPQIANSTDTFPFLERLLTRLWTSLNFVAVQKVFSPSQRNTMGIKKFCFSRHVRRVKMCIECINDHQCEKLTVLANWTEPCNNCTHKNKSFGKPVFPTTCKIKRFPWRNNEKLEANSTWNSRRVYQFETTWTGRNCWASEISKTKALHSNYE